MNIGAKTIMRALLPNSPLPPSAWCPRCIERVRATSDMRLFMSEYRAAFPDLCFRPVGDMIAEGDRVVVRWEGGGTHTGKALGDFGTKLLRERSGRKIWISGTTLLTVKNGRIEQEQVLFDGVAAMQQLGLMRPATPEEWSSDQELFSRY